MISRPTLESCNLWTFNLSIMMLLSNIVVISWPVNCVAKDTIDDISQLVSNILELNVLKI